MKKIKKKLKIKLEDKIIPIEIINNDSKELLDIRTVFGNIIYKLKTLSVISEYACNILMILHPVVVRYRKIKGKDSYDLIANQRTYFMAKVVLGDKAKIPVKVIKNRAESIIRDIAEIGCVGSPMVYSICDNRTFGYLIMNMKNVYKIIFPSLNTDKLRAKMIRVTAETLFYGNSEDEIKNNSKNHDNARDNVMEEDLSERYKEGKGR